MHRERGGRERLFLKKLGSRRVGRVDPKAKTCIVCKISVTHCKWHAVAANNNTAKQDEAHEPEC